MIIFSYSPFSIICAYKCEEMWEIESITIFNLINCTIMALVFHLPLWMKHSQNINFLKYFKYQITCILFLKEIFKILWIVLPNQVKWVLMGEHDEYSFKISLHVQTNPIIFYFLLNEMAESLVLLFSYENKCIPRIPTHCEFTIQPNILLKMICSLILKFVSVRLMKWI